MTFSLRPVSTLRQAASYAYALGGCVLVDLDGTLVPTGRIPDRLPVEIDRALAELRQRGGRVLVVTNRRLDARSVWGLPVVQRAKKPWTRRTRLPTDASCIIGDQLLTDGMLAWRLHLPMFHVASLDTRRRPLACFGDALLRIAMRRL